MRRIFGIVAENIDNFHGQVSNMLVSLPEQNFNRKNVRYFQNAALGTLSFNITNPEIEIQPLVTRQSGCGIIFDGELFDIDEIKKDLIDYPFQTNTDMEVLLALYEKYGTGPQMTAKLNGAFSFAIWDEKTNRLYAARDRFAEKPFYYAFGDNGELIFASDVKTIISTKLFTPIMDYDALGFYLKYSYIHPKQNIYKNVYTLAPASQLIFQDGKLTVSKYWDFPEPNYKMTKRESVEKFADLYFKAVKKRASINAPIGVFLSGGIDSSSIVIESLKHNKNVKTFCFGFENSKASEIAYARVIADMYKTEHYEITDKDIDFGGILVDLVKNQGEPFAEPGIVPAQVISQFASKHCNTLITGDFADMTIAGHRYDTIVRKLNPPLKEKLKHIFLRKKDYFDKRHITVCEEFYLARSYFKNEELSNLGIPITEYIDKDFINYKPKRVDSAMRQDLSSYVPGNISKKLDFFASMNGFDVRAPFLDLELLEFCIEMPDYFKIACNKKVKLQLTANYVPDKIPYELVNRPKVGFAIPIREYANKNVFEELKKEYLEDPTKKIYDIIDYNQFKKNVDFTKDDTYINVMRVWTPLIFSIWLENAVSQGR